MAEIELKFQVPAARLAAVRRAVATPTARISRLRAKYFDTPDRRLAEAGLALRIRLEDGLWVQTLKGRGAAQFERLEHEVALVRQRGVPALDIARHADTPVGEQLAAVLGDQASALQVVFETDVRRTYRIARSVGCVVELALDIGEIRAGDARLVLSELEFELKSGELGGMLELAKHWVARHHLCLDVRSKSQRGDMLARGLDASVPVRAGRLALTQHMSPDAALRAIVRSCIEHYLPNAAELAAGTGQPEHVHQARVALRRLRTALRLFGDWSVAVDAEWEPALAELFAQLGQARDRDVLAETLLPELLAAGAPSIELPSDDAGSAATDAACAARNVGLILDLIKFSQGAAPRGEDAGLASAPVSLRALVRPRLKRLHKRLKKDAEVFLSVDDTQRHRTRKRLKRLRYGLDLTASLLAPKALRRCLESLGPAQEALGLHNDLIVAEAAFREQLQIDARAWFALGWLAERRTQVLKDASIALDELARTPLP